MLRRSNLITWLMCASLLTSVFTISSLSVRQATADDALAEPPAQASEVDAIKVPEGTDPVVLQRFIQSLGRMRASEPGPAGFRKHFRRLLVALETILERDIDSETAQVTTSMMSQCYDILSQLRDPEAAEQKAAFIKDLKESDRKVLAKQGRMLEVESRVSALVRTRASIDKEAAEMVIDQVTGILEDRPLTNAHASLAFGAMTAIEEMNDGDLAVKAAKAFGDALRSSDDPTFASLAATMEGSARRINLKGQPIEVAGKTMTGEDFNVEQWKGKVVLVDFWATWCGPCVQAMPELVELYQEYHDQGLEIVGVSLDDSRPQLEEFLHQKQLPWPTLFHEGAGQGGQDHPLATYYGVSTVPTAFLVNREGNVVATDLYGAALSEAVAELVEGKGKSE